MTEIFYIKKNDLQPYYPVQVKDSSGNVVPITGATIYCTMKADSDGTLKIDRQTDGIVITDAANSEFEYRWVDGDTDTIGNYKIEFEIVPTSGGKFTMPAKPDETAKVFIVDSLDTT